MAYEQRLQSDGPIYTNNYKQTDKQPDWTGKVDVQKELLKELVTKIKGEDSASFRSELEELKEHPKVQEYLLLMKKQSTSDSVEVRVALWDRTSKKGNEYKYARLDVPQQQKKPEPAPPPAPEPEVDDFDDDDIPF